MLNRVLLMQKLQNIASNLFVDDTEAHQLVHAIWKKLCADPLLAQKLKGARVSWPVPSWQGALDGVYEVKRADAPYSLIAVDGSQIYPDRHYGLSCYLINVGQVILRYGEHAKPVQLLSVPYVFPGYDNEEPVELSAELINCKRQDLELRYGAEWTISLEDDKESLLLLFDGSLIFWHLEAHDVVLKEAFLSRYTMHLMSLYRQRICTASYISLPKSRELLNIVRSYLCNFDEKNLSKSINIDRIFDASIVHSYICDGQRTTVFKNHARVSEQYPDAVQPHFFYIHIGTEVGRVEIPAWVAQDERLVNRVATYIYDQCLKGGGYPVGLAEAHEQAVVKGPDRDFFYHLLTKMSLENKREVVHSQKAQRKRSIGV